MSFKLALLCLGLSLTYANAQVGIPTNNPNKDAVLDLNRTDGTSAKGLLFPKVALSSTTDPSPMSAHVAGMHIWNTATVTGANGVTPGEYFNDGEKWSRISSTADSWIQDGNNNGTLKAIGTNDAFDLPITTNGVEKMRVTSAGQVLVNTKNPMTGGTNAKLQINNGTTAGAIQIKDGTEGIGKFLTSDANGLAKWTSNNLIGVWNLNNGGQAFTPTVYIKETGTSTILPGDQIGLTAGTNSVTVPAGRYIVFVSHDIAGWEIGANQILSSTGTVLFAQGYTSWLSTSFILDIATPTILESYFRADNFPGQTIFIIPPYTASVALKVTFLKI